MHMKDFCVCAYSVSLLHRPPPGGILLPRPLPRPRLASPFCGPSLQPPAWRDNIRAQVRMPVPPLLSKQLFCIHHFKMFCATKHPQVHAPVPPTFVFVIDVSHAAISNGMLSTVSGQHQLHMHFKQLERPSNVITCTLQVCAPVHPTVFVFVSHAAISSGMVSTVCGQHQVYI